VWLRHSCAANRKASSKEHWVRTHISFQMQWTFIYKFSGAAFVSSRASYVMIKWHRNGSGLHKRMSYIITYFNLTHVIIYICKHYTKRVAWRRVVKCRIFKIEQFLLTSEVRKFFGKPEVRVITGMLAIWWLCWHSLPLYYKFWVLPWVAINLFKLCPVLELWIPTSSHWHSPYYTNMYWFPVWCVPTKVRVTATHWHTILYNYLCCPLSWRGH